MAYKPKAPAVMSEPNVIPMADIMLVLLIIFMVVTPMLQKGVSVDLAQVDNPRDMQAADQDDAIIVSVSRDNSIFLQTGKGSFDLVKCSPEQVRDRQECPQITDQVRDLVSSRIDKTVYVKSDARARYGTVVAVVNAVRSAGVDQLGLLTEKRETRRPGVPPAGGN